MPCLSTGRNRGRRYGPFLHLFQCCVFSLFSLFSNSWGDRRFLPSNSRALYSPQIWNRFLSSHSFFFFLAGEISLAIRTLCRFDDTGDSPPPTWLVLSMNDGKFLPRRVEQTLMSVQHSFPPPVCFVCYQIERLFLPPKETQFFLRLCSFKISIPSLWRTGGEAACDCFYRSQKLGASSPFLLVLGLLSAKRGRGGKRPEGKMRRGSAGGSEGGEERRKRI